MTTAGTGTKSENVVGMGTTNMGTDESPCSSLVTTFDQQKFLSVTYKPQRYDFPSAAFITVNSKTFLATVSATCAVSDICFTAVIKRSLVCTCMLCHLPCLEGFLHLFFCFGYILVYVAY